MIALYVFGYLIIGVMLTSLVLRFGGQRLGDQSIILSIIAWLVFWVAWVLWGTAVLLVRAAKKVAK